MKKIGFVIILVALVATSSVATYFALQAFIPKKNTEEAGNQTNGQTTDGNNAKVNTDTNAQTVSIVDMNVQAKFTPETVLELGSLSEDYHETALTEDGSDSERLVSADGKTVIVSLNSSGARLAKDYTDTASRTKALTESLGRVLIAEENITYNPNGIDMADKNSVAVPIDGVENKKIEFVRVDYTYKKADGEYRVVALVRHGSGRNMIVYMEKKASDWTTEEENKFINSVKVGGYGE